MPVTACANAPSLILPEAVYSLNGFITNSGLSYSRIQQAKREGLTLPTIRCGKRVFVEGSAGIEFIKQLALHSARARK